MTPARTVIAALLLFSGAIPVNAQDPAGTGPRGSAATGQIEPAPGEPIVRPKRGRLLDVIRAIAPPLIEAASSRPPPVADTAPQPVAPVPTATPAATTPAPAETGAAVVSPPPPRPRPIQAEPKPSAPRPLPAAAPRPTPPIDRPAPEPRSAPPAEALAPLAPTTAPPVAGPSPPPPLVARTVPPPLPVETPTRALVWNGPLVVLLGIAAAIAALVGAHHLRRMRRIARTRAALGISPRLDPAAGASSINGVSLVAPPLSIRARLAPAAYG